MVLNNLFANNNLIGKAMDATNVRHDAILNNIANVDVPGFQRSVVEFESYLERELSRTGNQPGEINFNNIQPSVNISNEHLAHRLDGNNVDIEMEMVGLYQNSTRYDVLANSLMNNYRRINAAINSNI